VRYSVVRYRIVPDSAVRYRIVCDSAVRSLTIRGSNGSRDTRRRREARGPADVRALFVIVARVCARRITLRVERRCRALFILAPPVLFNFSLPALFRFKSATLFRLTPLPFFRLTSPFVFRLTSPLLFFA
jgi:hypothetical protein